MHWDPRVDNKAHINAVATTIFKKPMPSTTYDEASEAIL